MTLGYHEIKDEMTKGNQRARDPYYGAQVTFKMEEVPDHKKSQELGRAQTRFVEMTVIERPGQDITARLISDQDKERFPQMYEAFIASEGGEQVSNMSGLALSKWTPLTRDQVRELITMGFKTVEQLAVANSAVQKKMGPLQIWVKRAKEWVDASDSPQAKVASLTERLETLEKKHAALLEQNEILIRRLQDSEGSGVPQ
jgi:hypothetical protein